jgi:flagellar motor switch protein FliG
MAAILYSLIGDHLPQEAVKSLGAKEIQKLMDGLSSLGSTNTNDEKEVLAKFTGALQKKTSKPSSTRNTQIYNAIHNLIDEGLVEKSLIQKLKSKKKEELNLLVKDEDPKVVAMVICFADPDEVPSLIEDFPSSFREKILIEINSIDFHSEEIRDELERFLKFKTELIETDSILSKIQNRGGRKAAEILARLSPNLSIKLLSKIKEINPEYAENIKEHFFTFKDFLKIDRVTLSKFLSSFNPIVVAFALKGVEAEISEEILEKCEPWLNKSIHLEMDCMGPITLAEIEEAQKAIIEQLHKSIDTGEIKLWKDK